MDAEVLSSLLPVTVTDDDLSQFPLFSKLLQSLTDQISPNGMDQTHAEDLKRLTHALDNEKQQYFQNKIVLDTVKEILMDRYAKPFTENSDDKQQARLSNALLQMINVAETEHILNISQFLNEEINLLGVNREWLYDVNKPIQDTECNLTLEQHIQYNIYPELEDRLQQKYDAISHFYQPIPNGSVMSDSDYEEASQSQFLNVTGAFASRYNLPSLIDKHKKRTQSEKDNLQKDQEKLKLDFWIYLRKMLQCLEILVTLLEDYKLHHFKDFDELSLRWSQERCKTMRLKLNVIRLEYLTATYHREVLESLKQMKQTLEEEYEKSKIQSNQADRELEQYASVGRNFDKLVEEFTQITSKIKLKRWEIQQLDQDS